MYCFGKGSKERVVYFDAKTKTHLQKYGSDAINKPLMAAEPSVSYKKQKYLRLNSLTIKRDF